MTDLAELFARDPLTYTRDDLRFVVMEMRKSRTAFAAGNMKAGKSPATRTKKETDISRLITEVNISL